MYLILPIISSFFWSSINIIDEYLVRVYSDNRSISILMVYSTLIGLPIFLLLSSYLYFFSGQHVFVDEYRVIFLSILAGVLYIFGVYFYLKSLEMSNAAVVMPQLLMMPVFSLLLGYFFLGETISLGGLLGISLITWGSVLLNLEKDVFGKVLFNKSLLLFALIASLFLAMNSFLFKYIVLSSGAAYLNVLTYEHLGFFISGLFIVAYKDNLRVFIRSFKGYGAKILALNITGEILNVIGNSVFHLATLYIPLAYAHTAADGSQPFIVLALSYLFVRLGFLDKSSLPKRGAVYVFFCVITIFIGLMCLYF